MQKTEEPLSDGPTRFSSCFLSIGRNSAARNGAQGEPGGRILGFNKMAVAAVATASRYDPESRQPETDQVKDRQVLARIIVVAVGIAVATALHLSLIHI